MTEEPDKLSSTTSDLSVAETTSSRGAEFYFNCAVVFIGVVGTAANALILYAMVVSDQHKKQVLIFHQNVADLCASLFLVITSALTLCNIYLTGTLGYWLCMIIFSENLVWCSTDTSVVNLLSVTVERYLKVVHPTRAKKLLSNRLIYSVIAFSWIFSITYNMAMVFTTSRVISGVCYAAFVWQSRVAALIFNIWYFGTFILVVVVVTVFCYGRILFVIRRQASVMAGHGAGTASITAHAQTQSQQIQSNVIKTMMLVSAFYVVAWMPIRLYFFFMGISIVTYDANVYYLTMLVAFPYICANPFIYATKFTPVKRVLLDLIPCKRSQPQQAAAGGYANASGIRTVQTRV